MHVTLEQPHRDPPAPWWRDIRGLGAALLGIGLILAAIAAALPLFR